MRYSGYCCDIYKTDIFKPVPFKGVLKAANPIKIKIKRYSTVFDESGWTKLDICTKCAEKIYDYCTKEVNKNG